MLVAIGGGGAANWILRVLVRDGEGEGLVRVSA